jgi:hypothetical protein
MKKYISFLALVALVMLISSCNKEDPLPVDATFTTNIEGNTLETREGFTVYTDQTEGEFLAYYKGDSEENNWGTGFGTPFEVGTDSLNLPGYAEAGSYTFTIVATSYGNWGETLEQDINSIDITVTESE